MRVWVTASLLIGCSGSTPPLAPTGDVPGGDPAPAGDQETGDPGDVGPAPLIGVYTLTGEDEAWGTYTGTAEIRAATGRLEVIHLQLYDDARFEGDRIAQAWVGHGSEQSPVRVEVTLSRARFIHQYQQWSRAGQTTSPATFVADFERTAPDVLAGTFASSDDARTWTETWTWMRASDPEPIWRNLRQAIEVHAPISETERDAAFLTFESFHALPSVQPYVDRPEFNAAMHYTIFDPTNFDFYRRSENRDVLRVIQHIVDPIGLVETRIRNRAYRQTVTEKAAHYDAEVPLKNINAAGLVAFWKPDPPSHWYDYDSLEWTGDYVMSQAMRYRVTGEQAALDNVLRSLDGIILAYDIVPESGQFARAIRLHVEGDTNPDWIHAGPPFEMFDWHIDDSDLPNKDMIVGFLEGFLWAYIVLDDLGGYDSTIARMATITGELVEDNFIIADGLINEANFRLLLYVLNEDPLEYARYLGMFEYLGPYVVDLGLPYFYYGMSDWSGNYMNIKSLINWYVAELVVESRGVPVYHQDDFREAMRNGLENLRHTRLGFYQLAAAALGNFETTPPELEDALWVMREFPAPKVTHDIDRRIDPDFCLSPFPNLPWKLDWTEPTEDRTFSVTSYPLLERQPTKILWISGPGKYRKSASSNLSSGVDYLIAYWTGRYFGFITDQM